jgi:hypothetical protein
MINSPFDNCGNFSGTVACGGIHGHIGQVCIQWYPRRKCLPGFFEQGPGGEPGPLGTGLRVSFQTLDYGGRIRCQPDF